MGIRTRFAPSPTGFLHVGGLRTALYNYVFSKKNNGQFILRIEDTDQNRLVKDASSQLINIFKKFNIDFDEGPGLNEIYGPYKQSERLDIYKSYYIQLIKNKTAYVCFNNNESTIPEYDVSKALDKINTNSFIVKLKIPKNKKIEIYDQLRGKIEFDYNLIDDPIIIKSDGFPTYHFANVIDDHLMRISHVIRGEEWISSLPKHVLLYNYLDWELPKFIHLPLLLNPDKSKLSKRQGDVNVDDFLSKGYLKETIINFIALLGWHPSNDNEIFSLDKLIDSFSIQRIQKSGAIFDIKKLNWMNSQYIKNMDNISLMNLVESIYIDNKIDISDKNKLTKVIDFAKNRVHTINEIFDETAPFYRYNPENNKLLYNSFNKDNCKKLFNFWYGSLLSLDNINKQYIDILIKKTSEELSINGKDIFHPLRCVLYGNVEGPDLYTIISILGIKESLLRIKKNI